jgi:hypothetical protein
MREKTCKISGYIDARRTPARAVSLGIPQGQGSALLLDGNWHVERAALAGPGTPPKTEPCGPISYF